MSAKKIIFPPDSDQPAGGRLPETMEDLYTGHPGYNGHGQGMPEDGDPQSGGRGAAKGRAAYAAHDEMPSFQPRGAGIGSLGGLIPDSPPAAGDQSCPSGDDGLLSVISDDALREECQKRICPSCPVKKDADDMRLRALADLDNARKRMAREHEEQARFAAESILADVIPSLDNLDLALQHAGSDQACKNFVTGVQMTRKLLAEALAKHGLQQVGERGEEFNPAFHEAVGMISDPEMPDNYVCSLLSNGYKLHDRLLRPARVMVCKKS